MNLIFDILIKFQMAIMYLYSNIFFKKKAGLFFCMPDFFVKQFEFEYAHFINYKSQVGDISRLIKDLR